MARFSSSIFILLIAAIVFTSCARQAGRQASPQPVAPKVVWSETINGYTVRWTTGDITAVSTRTPGRPIFSELGRAIVHFSSVTQTQTSSCDFQREARLQSVVGSIVSVRESDSTHCQNGVTGTGLGAAAVDLAHPKKPATLSDFFPAYALASARIRASQLCKSVPKDLLSRFAFGELHGNTVVVLLTLSPECSSTEFNLALPVAASLKQPLVLAARKKQGFLWHDQPAISRGNVTRINYHYRTSTGS